MEWSFEILELSNQCNYLREKLILSKKRHSELKAKYLSDEKWVRKESLRKQMEDIRINKVYKIRKQLFEKENKLTKLVLKYHNSFTE